MSTLELSADSKKAPPTDLPEIGGARGAGGGGAGARRVAPDLGERITTPAVQNKQTGQIETQAGADHNQLMNRFYNKGYKPAKGQMQSEHFRNGYMTSAGRFVTSEEAFQIAKARGQIKPDAKYSEKWQELFFDEYKIADKNLGDNVDKLTTYERLKLIEKQMEAGLSRYVPPKDNKPPSFKKRRSLKDLGKPEPEEGEEI